MSYRPKVHSAMFWCEAQRGGMEAGLAGFATRMLIAFPHASTDSAPVKITGKIPGFTLYLLEACTQRDRQRPSMVTCISAADVIPRPSLTMEELPRSSLRSCHIVLRCHIADCNQSLQKYKHTH